MIFREIYILRMTVGLIVDSGAEIVFTPFTVFGTGTFHLEHGDHAARTEWIVAAVMRDGCSADVAVIPR